MLNGTASHLSRPAVLAVWLLLLLLLQRPAFEVPNPFPELAQVVSALALLLLLFSAPTSRRTFGEIVGRRWTDGRTDGDRAVERPSGGAKWARLRKGADRWAPATVSRAAPAPQSTTSAS